MKDGITLAGANKIFETAGIQIRRDDELGLYRASVNGIMLMKRTILSLCQAIVEELAKEG